MIKELKEVDHVLDKYTNKRAWARWNRTAKPEKIKDKDILRDIKKTAGILTDLEDKRVNFNGFEIPAKLKREDKKLQKKAFEHINKDKKGQYLELKIFLSMILLSILMSIN